MPFFDEVFDGVICMNAVHLGEDRCRISVSYRAKLSAHDDSVRWALARGLGLAQLQGFRTVLTLAAILQPEL